MKILIFGNSPLPDENVDSRPALGLRTYHFLKPIQDDGYQILLITFDDRGDDIPASPVAIQGGQHYYFSGANYSYSGIKTLVKDFHPEVCVGVNTRTASFAADFLKREKIKIPFWADLNGWLMAERQAQSFRQHHDEFLSHAWEMEKTILMQADKFSAVSNNQKCCLLGELAAVGRLNSHTEGYNFAHTIQNATEHFQTDEIEVDSPKLFRDKLVANDDFVIAWIGGYNTWADEQLLFESLELAMSQNNKIHFVSTGGEINSVCTEAYRNFRKFIENSNYKNRFHFLGWVQTRDVVKLYQEADIGINVDRDCTETHTGARNRLTEMLKLGLPMLTTGGSEIAEDIRQAEIGVVTRRNKKDLADAITKLATQPELRHQLAQKGKVYCAEHYNYEKTTKKLMDWLKNPRLAPDQGYRLNIDKVRTLQAIYYYWKMNGLTATIKKIRRKIK